LRFSVAPQKALTVKITPHFRGSKWFEEKGKPDMQGVSPMLLMSKIMFNIMLA